MRFRKFLYCLKKISYRHFFLVSIKIKIYNWDTKDRDGFEFLENMLKTQTHHPIIKVTFFFEKKLTLKCFGGHLE